MRLSLKFLWPIIHLCPFYVSCCDKIPVYVGAKCGLVEKYEKNGPGFHGEDGFGNAQFGCLPDMTKIHSDESACLALLRLIKSMPGKRNDHGRVCLLTNSN